MQENIDVLLCEVGVFVLHDKIQKSQEDKNFLAAFIQSGISGALALFCSTKATPFSCKSSHISRLSECAISTQASARAVAHNDANSDSN